MDEDFYQRAQKLKNGELKAKNFWKIQATFLFQKNIFIFSWPQTNLKELIKSRIEFP